MRVVGPNGISEPLTLTVGNVSEIPEVEPNHTLEQAQKISVPVVINGVVQAATEIDSFRFAAKKGEQFVLEVLAQRKGSPLDSSLAILDSKGKELARSEDALGFDSLIEFTAPEDGDFIAKLRDFQYRGAVLGRHKLDARESKPSASSLRASSLPLLSRWPARNQAASLCVARGFEHELFTLFRGEAERVDFRRGPGRRR